MAIAGGGVVWIYACDGDDLVRGLGGDDSLIGNGGQDGFLGGAGNDTLVGDNHVGSNMDDYFLVG